MTRTQEPTVEPTLSDEQTAAIAAMEARKARLAAVKATEQATRDARTSVTRERKAKAEPKPCQDGCGEYAASGSRFLPGHDAKLKSALLTIAHGEDEARALQALEVLDRLGWSKFFVARKSA